MTKKSKFKNLTFDPYNWGNFVNTGTQGAKGYHLTKFQLLTPTRI